jgi:hypothetical protein
MAATSFFETLGVREDATASQIRAAYLARITELHPDVTSDPELHQQAADVNVAYSLLRDEQQRARYRTEVRMSRFRAEWRARETVLRLGDGPMIVPVPARPSNVKLFAISFAVFAALLAAPLATDLFGSAPAQARAERTHAACNYTTAFAVRSCLSSIKSEAPGEGEIPLEMAADNAGQ